MYTSKKIINNASNLLSMGSSEKDCTIKSREQEYRNLAKAITTIEEERAYYKVDYSSIPSSSNLDSQGRTNEEQIKLRINNLISDKQKLETRRKYLLDEDNEIHDTELFGINRKLNRIYNEIETLTNKH